MVQGFYAVYAGVFASVAHTELDAGTGHEAWPEFGTLPAVSIRVIEHGYRRFNILHLLRVDAIRSVSQKGAHWEGDLIRYTAVHHSEQGHAPEPCAPWAPPQCLANAELYTCDAWASEALASLPS